MSSDSVTSWEDVEDALPSQDCIQGRKGTWPEEEGKSWLYIEELMAVLGHSLVWYFLALSLASGSWQQTKMQVRRMAEATGGKDREGEAL